VLRLGSASLKSKLQAMTGTRPPREIVFDNAANVEISEESPLRQLAGQLISELDATGITNSIAAIEMESMVATMFLLGKRHNYSEALSTQPKSSAPFQVRLAEEYMEAHWDKPITIDTLTRVTGVSARSLFERFQSYRGVSPIAFLRGIRLEHARRMLMSPKPDTTVTGVALACGFLNTGHFARHYREAFGEMRPRSSPPRAR
jgi:AraC-like DNA-binding protein